MRAVAKPSKCKGSGVRAEEAATEAAVNRSVLAGLSGSFIAPSDSVGGLRPVHPSCFQLLLSNSLRVTAPLAVLPRITFTLKGVSYDPIATEDDG